MTAEGGRNPLVQVGLLLTAAALASRALGWLRLLVIGAQFGASSELDAYLAAFRIPDMIFQLVVAGALSAALIPVYASYRARGEDQEAWAVAASIINLIVLALAAISLVMAILAPVLMPLIAPGFDDPTTELTVRLSRIMLLSPVLIGTGAVVSGLLNSHYKFGAAAVAPLVYNLAIIGAAVLLAPVIGIEGLAVGVVIGAAGHLLIQLPSLVALRPTFTFRVDFGHPGVRRVGTLIGPRTFGLAAGQVNLIVSTILASGLAAGSITAFTYAFQLTQIPVGVIGVSVAVALFPTLSRDAALGRMSEIRRQVAGSVRVLVFIAAPLTALMIVLREPLTSVFFEYGRFSPQAAAETANALAFFALGLIGHVVVHVLTRAFYAMQDTQTPVIWAVVAVVLNIGLMLALVGRMGVEGLALAISLSATLEVAGLLWALRTRIGSIDGPEMAASAARSAGAAVVAGVVMAAGLVALTTTAPGLDGDALGRLVLFAVPAVAGSLAFLLAATALRSPELVLMRREIGRYAGSRR